MASDDAREVEIDGRRLRVTNLDKVLYPAAEFTKGQVIDYYARVAEALVPHLAGRPLTLKRYPEGVDAGFFFEKRCPEHRPDWVATAPVWVDRRAGEIDFCVCDDRPTLVWLAQLAALELHPSLSLAERIERPTVLAFDLDPGPPADIADCARVGLRLQEMFADLGVDCFAKTSGSKGMQVYLPLNTETTYEQTKPYAQAVARLLEKQSPDQVVSRMAKEMRRGKVFVDWSQNHQKKTTVAVYSLRARERPTVSAPVGWDEVEQVARGGDTSALSFEANEVLDRLDDRGDLFAPVLELEQELPGVETVSP